MNITIQPTSVADSAFFPTPTIRHFDHPSVGGDLITPAFSTAELTIGDDAIKIFLPYGGRITYTNTKENA